MSSSEADRSAYDAWRQLRLQQVSGPAGNIALVDYQRVGGAPEQVRGLPATVHRVGDEEGVRVRPLGELELVTASGAESIGEETLVRRLGPDGLPLLRAGSVTADVFSLDGTGYELRIYDAEAPALDDFDGIETVDHDPAWVVPAVFEAHDEVQQVPWGFTRDSDTGHTKAVPGTVRAEIDGVPYAFSVFADGPALVLVFADATTGSESYAPGRFLRLDAVASGAAITLDFNRAIVPPCGFSDYYSCPIPPAQNRVAAAVRAGELRARWRSGSRAH
ncbi:DUF1684 domain-containing protein [Microbacterium marinilacus]|uniref:DUF1684 domain-containing protein n=1 Tax=Microbacterium marinilacus TaxID=415209 RepID=A0ABP7B9R8_9MICO|nr:DUF1684 domain-containing protein [Microbacterium marinilacus]MBY0687088.1 DUF1684 domain-containing protein [Microbacterium marinilacus]